VIFTTDNHDTYALYKNFRLITLSGTDARRNSSP